MKTAFLSTSLLFLLSCTEEKEQEVEFEQNSSQWDSIGTLAWEAETIASGVDKAVEADFRLVTQSGDQLWYSDPTLGFSYTIEDTHLQGVGVYGEPIFFTDEGVFIWERGLDELSLSPLNQLWNDTLITGHYDSSGLWLLGEGSFYRWTEAGLHDISS